MQLRYTVHGMTADDRQVSHSNAASRSFIDDRKLGQKLGREVEIRLRHREAGGEIEAHLVAEHRQRAGAGAVAFLHAVLENMFHQIEILAQTRASRRFKRLGASLADNRPFARFQLQL